MEKPIQIHHQQQQLKSHETLKCPRCNSSNTKFCYYNNYSLSQPRHFCKACKRYWTRGGTLRNVPVGGGCRKNKRLKRPITTSLHHVVAATPSPVNPQTNLKTITNLDDHNPIPSSTTTTNISHHLNPLFYGLLSQNPNYPRIFDTRVTNETPVSGYDLLQPHMKTPSGLVFSSSGSFMANHGHNQNLTFSSYNSSMYGSSTGSTFSSTIASTIDQQQRFIGFADYDGGSLVKDQKMEETQNMMEWNISSKNNNFHDQNKINDHQLEEAVVSSDPNSILWDTEGGGWLSPTNHNNIGSSSVPSLI